MRAGIKMINVQKEIAILLIVFQDKGVIKYSKMTKQQNPCICDECALVDIRYG